MHPLIYVRFCITFCCLKGVACTFCHICFSFCCMKFMKAESCVKVVGCNQCLQQLGVKGWLRANHITSIGWYPLIRGSFTSKTHQYLVSTVSFELQLHTIYARLSSYVIYFQQVETRVLIFASIMFLHHPEFKTYFNIQ